MRQCFMGLFIVGLSWALLLQGSYVQAATVALESVRKQVKSVSISVPAAYSKSMLPEESEQITVVRIMFLYLDAVLQYHNLAQLKMQLDSWLNQANAVFANSGVQVVFEMAYLGRWPEEAQHVLHDHDIKQVFDAVASNIHTLWSSKFLEKWSADVLFLVDQRVQDPYCGWASIGSLTDLMATDFTRSYGILRLGPGCGNSAFTLPHELGHLLGAGHGLEESVLATDTRGYGYACAQRYTIMHTRFAKHPFFSDPHKIVNSEVCGEEYHANNSQLLKERILYLAEKTKEPIAHSYFVTTIDLKDDVDQPALHLQFERFGLLQESAAFDAMLFSANDESLIQQLHVNFEAGESYKMIEVEWPFVSLDPYVLAYYNFYNVQTVTMQQMAFELTELLSPEKPPYFSVQIQNLTLVIDDVQNVDAANVSWDFGDGVVSSELYAEHTYAVPGNYTLTMYIGDLMSKPAVSIMVRVGQAQAHSLSLTDPSEASFNNLDSDSTGGSISFLGCLCLMSLMFLQSRILLR